MVDLRYPIGLFEVPRPVLAHHVEQWIEEIESLPEAVRSRVEDLDDTALSIRYRPGGWSVRQVVHHLADSHLNSFVRFKWALTEESPMIKAYDEKAWAELADSDGPVDATLQLLTGLHARWGELLRSLTPDQLMRTFDHPESGSIDLATNIGVYAWHGRHHLAHLDLALSS